MTGVKPVRLLSRESRQGEGENAVVVEDLIETCGERLWRLCLALTGSRAEAEELYQQTFLRALECERRLDPEGNPGAWLCATASGLWKSRLRRRARRAAIAPRAEETELENLPGEGEPEELLLREERKRRVRELLDGLEERYRTPLLLYYAGGLSVEETAAALRLPAGTVKSRLARGRERIRDEWEVWEHG